MLDEILKKHSSIFHRVVPFNEATDKLLLMDFADNNKTISTDIITNTEKFANYVQQKLNLSNAMYGIGGYNEERSFYSRSNNFDGKNGAEPRRLHLGIDIWGQAGTAVFAPLGGMVHSFAFNSAYADYGATIILLHQLDGFAFYTLYGHLSLRDIEHLKEGKYINRGEEFAHFGLPVENGQWPPHLHLQLIIQLEWKRGDYPGVCKKSESEKYLQNCPNPDLILNMMQFAAAV